MASITPRTPRTWTREEDGVLTEAIRNSEATEPIKWRAVATLLPGRSNKDCRKRWTCCLAPTIRKGTWSEKENSLLREAVAGYGMQWALISRHVGSRQPDQCSRRWHEVVKPNIDRGRWSLYEDHMLLSAVRAHGRRWTEIVERYFPNRTPIGTKNRYLQVSRREQDQPEISLDENGGCKPEEQYGEYTTPLPLSY